MADPTINQYCRDHHAHSTGLPLSELKVACLMCVLDREAALRAEVAHLAERVETAEREWHAAAERAAASDPGLRDTQARLQEVQAELAGLKTLLREVAPVNCDAIHHKAKDRHGATEPCPILTRLETALTEA